MSLPPNNSHDADADRQVDLRIGAMLRDRDLITEEHLEEALRLQATTASDRRLGEILAEQLQCVTNEDVDRTLAESLGITFTLLAPEMADADAFSAIPIEFIEQHNLLPLSMCDGTLTIAIERFTNVFLIDEISRLSGAAVNVVASTAESIRSARRAAMHTRSAGQNAADTGSLDQILGQIGVDDMQVVEEDFEEDADLESTATESPVVKLVNYIIKTAVQSNASDIHIEPEETGFRVRFRVDGDLVTSVSPPQRMLPAVVSRIKILGRMDISERRIPQDGGVTVTLFNRSVDLRISTMATKFGEKVVIRIVDRDAGLRSLAAIGMSQPMLERFRRVISEPNGIVLVTGPTGSGKSTTLYGALAEIVTDRRNYSTIEDPVERIIPGVNQFQVHPKAGFTFSSALRAILRQDPDVIMVGEIRDPETARLATEAALTGHLVLSTLHTNDAPTAVPRLVNMGVEPYLVAASLRGVLAQRLVRRLCPGCAQPVEINGTQRAALGRLCGGALPFEQVHAGAGCAECGGVGARGRIGVFDLLRFNETSLSAIAQGGAAQFDGAGGLLEDGLEKVREGQINLDALLEIIAHTEEAEPTAAGGEEHAAAA